jgi:hypothetical protein
MLSAATHLASQRHAFDKVQVALEIESRSFAALRMT